MNMKVPPFSMISLAQPLPTCHGHRSRVLSSMSVTVEIQAAFKEGFEPVGAWHIPTKQTLLSRLYKISSKGHHNPACNIGVVLEF